MAGGKASYSDEIWQALKKEYERGAKVSWAKLVEIISEKLGGCDMPSPSVVRRRAIAENWKKKVKNDVKKSATELNKALRKIQSNLTLNDGNQASDKQQKNTESQCQKNASNIAVVNVKNDSGSKRKDGKNSDYDVRGLNSTKVIKNNRNRLAKLGELAADTIDAVAHIRDEVLNIDFEEFTQEKEEEVKRSISFKITLMAEIVELNLKQAVTLSNIGRMEAVYWGLDQDDLKDQQEMLAKRSAHIENAQDILAQKKQRMLEAKAAAVGREVDIQAAAELIEKQGF